jgi:hypothetical protein
VISRYSTIVEGCREDQFLGGLTCAGDRGRSPFVSQNRGRLSFFFISFDSKLPEQHSQMDVLEAIRNHAGIEALST